MSPPAKHRFHAPVQPDSPAAKNRVDVHVHFVPDFYRDALNAAGQSKPDGIEKLPDWTEESALRLMDELGVQTSILSISSPGVHLGDDGQARELSRQVNEYSADLKKRHPGRFGHLASTPLPDVEASVTEAGYALDELHAEGVVVQSNHHGLYLGDERLEPLWAALNQRAAAVLVHPTSPSAALSERLNAKIPQPLTEFFFDTGRAVIDLVTAGVLERHPAIRFIVPHAGAVLSILTQRIDSALPLLKAKLDEPVPLLRDAMRKLHFDLAGLPVPEILLGLLNLADKTHLHYGSDFPFTPPPLVKKLHGELEHTPLLSDAERRAMFGQNARKLFPKLGGPEAVCLPNRTNPPK